MSLGDHFPDSHKEQFFEDNVKPGTVLYLHCSFTVPPKEKFLLIVSTDPLIVLFIINSEISRFVQNSQPHYQAQVLLKQQEHSFLRHDSYLDCSKNHQQNFPLEKIKTAILDDIGRVKGKVSRSACTQILQVIQVSRFFSPKEKQVISSSLSTYLATLPI